MKKEYDLSKAVRGRFYRKNAKIVLPVYLEQDVQSFVQSIAESKQSDISTIVNEILKSDMRLAEVIR